jgi:hypothetical protein
MDQLFIAEYINPKTKITDELEYNENNVESIIADVQDYKEFIYNFKNSSMKQDFIKKITKENSKELDKNKHDINSKIMSLKKELISSSFFKTDIKSGYVLDFDDIIKSKAEEILQKVNQMSDV